MEIRILQKQGMSIRGIARHLGVSRATVRKYLREPEREPAYRARSRGPSKLDEHKDFLRQRVAHAAPHRLPATVLLREIQERGYEGGITILREFLASERPSVPAPAIKRFETEPGYQAQIDWTSIRRGKDRLTAFVATLGFSRWSYVWFATDETFETLVAAHERFFDAIGGTPRTILYDNMKTVIIERDAYGDGEHRFHAGFRDFAKHHGFSPRACAPYRAQTKGKVERFNRYLKESFVRPLESRLKPFGFSLDANTANAEVGTWLRDVANVRIHGETKERPADRLAQEQPVFLPRAPRWGQEGQPPVADLTGIRIAQHDLSIYDSIGRAA